MQIGVVGSWEDGLSPAIYETAESVGRLIAERGGVLFTGGSTGVMEAAMKGAKNAGGLTVGLIPAERKSDYAHLGSHMDVYVLTGLGELGKMAPLIHSVAGVVAIAGGAGTLIEIAMAYAQGKPVVRIPFAGYTTAAIEPMMKDKWLDYRQLIRIEKAPDAQSAVSRLYERFGL
jgi:hypothetical protein